MIIAATVLVGFTYLLFRIFIQDSINFMSRIQEEFKDIFTHDTQVFPDEI